MDILNLGGAGSGIGAKLGKIFYTPVSSMSGVALLVIAGSRFSYAIVAACALVWVSIFSIFVSTFICGIKSETRIKILNVLISSFAGSLYFFFLYLLNPLLALETTLICMLAPIFYMGSKLSFSREDTLSGIIFQESVFELLALGGLTLAFSLIREPLGFSTLSIPDAKRGIIELFNTKGDYPYSIQLISSSTGALFLLSYIMVILRYINAGSAPHVDERRTEES
ncbi:MAG: hypothetical protein LBC27_03985 [Spirochaetaceae bacterium]|jgi:hypothetical protein|nr:hypothetical protein [Spirochaetaceae bacterium]